jgi:hypothetical protein
MVKAVEASVVGHRMAARTPAEQDGRDFAIGGDTLVLEEVLIFVRRCRHCRQIHLLHLMILVRAMGRERSRRSTLALMVR